VTIDSELAIIDQPSPATIDGEKVGELRVASWSPKLGRNIGLALLGVAHAEPGTKLRVDVGETPLEITVSDVAFGVSL